MKSHDENYLYENGLIWKGGHLPYNPKLKERATHMRKNMTIAEKYLWKGFLQKSGYKVLRQKPINNYVVDFYLPQYGIIIEVDGEAHNSQIKYDIIRTQLLEKYNLLILRFTNQDILNNLESVKNNIVTKIKKSPSLTKRG